MLLFAWITFITGLALSVIAAFFSIFGLALIYAGAFWPVVILTSILEIAKLVAVSWMYRYRYLAGRGVRIYFYSAIVTLMLITSLGIFGFLTRAHVETEGVASTAELTLREIQQRESQLLGQRDQITSELTLLNQQSTALVSQLGAAERLRGTQGAVAVQRETTARRAILLNDLKQLNAEVTVVQKERITTETETNNATADIGPLRYVAQAIYGNDDLITIRSAVVWLTSIVMVVFDPLAIMLLLAANMLFKEHTHLSSGSPAATPPLLSPLEPVFSAPVVGPSDPIIQTAADADVHTEWNNANISDVPSFLIRGDQ